MPQEGSVCAIAANVSSDFLYQKEWSNATARLKSGCTAGMQEVGKLTVPRLADSEGPCTCCATASGTSAAPTSNVTKRAERRDRISSFNLPFVKRLRQHESR